MRSRESPSQTLARVVKIQYLSVSSPPGASADADPSYTMSYNENELSQPGGVSGRAGFERRLGLGQEMKKGKAHPGQGTPGQVMVSGGGKSRGSCWAGEGGRE